MFSEIDSRQENLCLIADAELQDENFDHRAYITVRHHHRNVSGYVFLPMTCFNDDNYVLVSFVIVF